MQDDLKQLLQEHGGYITRRQIDEAGFEPYALTRAMRIGQIERIQRGGVSLGRYAYGFA